MREGPFAWMDFVGRGLLKVYIYIFFTSKFIDGPNTWDQFMKLEKKYLNIGAFYHRHPHPKYRNYTAVTVPPSLFQFRLVNLKSGKVEDNPQVSSYIKGYPTSPPYVIYHDVRNPFPLPDNSVDRLHSEDCFEHIERHQYISILNELYRILKPGCRFRLSVPDYNNPKDAFCLEKGFDSRHPTHVTMTTYNLMKEILHKTKFETIIYYHYWENGTFYQNPINYYLGYVSRTPDNDILNKISDGLHVTSLVVDLIKKL